MWPLMLEQCLELVAKRLHPEGNAGSVGTVELSFPIEACRDQFECTLATI